MFLPTVAGSAGTSKHLHRDTLHMLHASLRALVHDLTDPARLIPALSSGFVVGLLIIVVQLSLASLIFSGPLSAFAPMAAGLTLFGGFAMCLVVALGSSLPSSIALPQDAPAAIMATVATAIAASIGGLANQQEAFVTVGAAMAVSTLASGILFLLLGRFRLGNLVRYMPYPVVGGFMAGIGWLLVQGSFSIVVGVSLNLTDLPQLLSSDKILGMAPAVILTVVLLVSLKRWGSVFILPGALALALGSFAAYLLLTGQSLNDAANGGLLLGGMPEGNMLWPVFTSSDLTLIRWDVLVSQLPQLCTIPLVSVLSFLLIASGLETTAHSDLDLRHEFYLNGFANLVAGPGGSQTGYTALSFSQLGPRTGSDSRLVGVCASLFAGAATFFGASALGYFPRFILGGMVLFLGISTLIDWAVETRKKVTHLEYALILAILCAIGLFGFLAGVGFGLLMAAIIFVIKYSQLPVVRQDSDATALSSTRQRSVPDQHILRSRGGEVRVLRIMGYLFFGSANILSQSVTGKLQPHSGQTPSHIIIDFAEVDGFDSSAVNCFLRMLQRCAAADCRLIFAAPPTALAEQIRRAAPQESAALQFLPDLDRALEWCEDEVLKRALAHLEAGDGTHGREMLFDLAVDDLLLHLADAERFEALVEGLAPWVEPRQAQAGATILRQGDCPGGVFMFVSGQAEEMYRHAGGTAVRLRTLGPGCIAGQANAERGGIPAPGNITALTDCTLAFLSAAALSRLQTEAPATALAFYSLLAAQLESQLAKPAVLQVLS